MARRKDDGQSTINSLFSIPGISVLLGLIFSVYNAIVHIKLLRNTYSALKQAYSAYAFYNEYREKVNVFMQRFHALVTPSVDENEGLRKQIKFMIAVVLNGLKTTWFIVKRTYRRVFVEKSDDGVVVAHVVAQLTDDNGVVSRIDSNQVTKLTDDRVIDQQNDTVAEKEEAEEEGSLSLEIFKSLVYGGLMEIIASLCNVAFFANFDATTMNMAAFALAGFIGGLFYFVINMWELWNSCHKVNWSEEMKKEVIKKYREILGRVKYFPLHAALATLSFVIFGMIPPATYVVSLVKTNDKKYTIEAVTVVSLLCISLLAISKAYVIKCKGIFEYVKTVGYYQIIAVGVSFCSYLASYLFKGWMEELRLFDKNSCDAVSHL